MPSYIVTASTSVVLVDTSVLGPNESTIVYLSAATTPGQVVTVRDSLGYLSSPQSILVSTTAGVQFADGTSSLRFSQPYASASFSAADTSNWNIINTFAFPLNATVASVKSLTASTLIGNSINIGGSLSTAAVVADSMDVQSTTTVAGNLATNSLFVGSGAPPTLSTGQLYVDGNVSLAGATTVLGNVAVAGQVSVSSLLTVGGQTAIGGNFTVAGDTSIGGNVATSGTGTLTVGSLAATSTATILGQATFNSNVSVLSTLTVNQSTVTNNATASTVTIGSGGFLQLNPSGGPTLRGRNDIIAGQTIAAWSGPLYTPYVSSGTVQTANTANVGVLNVTGIISANTVSQVNFGSAAINNSNGSLVVGSLTANTATLSNALTAQTLQASTILASSIQVQNAVTVASAAGYFSTGTLNADTVSTGQISSGQVVAGVLLTPAVNVSSLYVNRNIEGATNLSSVVIPNAVVDNSAGRFQTATLLANTVTASTLAIQTGVIASASTIRITASTVTIANPYFSSFTASSFQTSTLTTTRLTLGAPTTSNSPDFFYDSAQGVSTNVLVTGGPGNFLTPFTLSNIIPTGQNPATPYTTFIGFDADFKGQPPPPGMVIDYSANFFWAGQTNSQLVITGGPTLSGASGQNLSTTGTLVQSSFSINASLFGSSAISVTFQFRYTPNATYVDSNTVIEMNNGRLNWNYALNGTTIQNSLNDMTTRNLFYYGSLNFASDPRIKEDIRDADLARCYETIRDLPVRQFRYCSAYCSEFQVEPTPRLGLLATDVQRVFPKSVHMSDTLMPSFGEPLMTIDTQQVEMAHLGATKYLIQEVERLEAALSTLDARAVN